MDEHIFKKFRNLVSTSPKPRFSWSEAVARNHPSLEATKRLVLDFLVLVSRDDVMSMLDDILSPRQKEELPALGNLDDPKGGKRLAKLTLFLNKSPALNPWTVRYKKDEAIRLETELTARKSLMYLSGGQLLPLLNDMLHPGEKEFFCSRYRNVLTKVGEAFKHLNPKSKAMILSAIRQSGMTKEALKEMNWVFSNNLWNVGAMSGGLRMSMEDLASLNLSPSRPPKHRALYQNNSDDSSASPISTKHVVEQLSRTYTTTTSRTVTTTGKKLGAKKKKSLAKRLMHHPFGMPADSGDEQGDEDSSPMITAKKSKTMGEQQTQNHIFLNNFLAQHEMSDSEEDNDQTLPQLIPKSQ